MHIPTTMAFCALHHHTFPVSCAGWVHNLVCMVLCALPFHTFLRSYSGLAHPTVSMGPPQLLNTHPLSFKAVRDIGQWVCLYVHCLIIHPVDRWNIFQHVKHDSTCPFNRSFDYVQKCILKQTIHLILFNHPLGDVTYDNP